MILLLDLTTHMNEPEMAVKLAVISKTYFCHITEGFPEQNFISIRNIPRSYRPRSHGDGRVELLSSPWK